jgi:FG-GAP repeat
VITIQPALTSQPALANRSLGMWPVALTGLRSRFGFGWRAGVFVALLPVIVLAVFVLAASPSPVGLGRAAGHDRAAGRGLAALPVAAQGAVSRALGRDDPSYRALAGAGGFRLRNPGQGLVALLGARGVEVRSGRARLHLSLSGYGYGGTLRALAAVSPRARGNRVVYGHGGLREWYTNGPLGLEQGFTLPTAPIGRRTGALTIALALSGNVRGSLSRGGGVTFAGPGGAALAYGGLVARDARGRTLPARIELRRGGLLLRVDDAGARYPLRIDPLVQQGAKLTGSGESGLAGFGDNVALSGDGNTALIGGGGDNKNFGAVWVFTRSGSTWTQQGEKLVGNCTSSCANEGTGESGEGLFGTYVALSSDGNTALIGGTGDNNNVGAAWVFTRSGSTWTQQGPKLVGNCTSSCANEGTGESGEGYFGFVTLSSDGNTALIGGIGDNGNVGAAWVFTRSGSTWTQQGPKLVGNCTSSCANEGTGESGAGQFGDSVALTSDGNTALIGGQTDNGNVGAAWVFTRSGGVWTQQGAKLTGSGESGEGWFGWSVALSADGNTALISGLFDNNKVGAAWVFTRSGSTWTQQGEKLVGNCTSSCANEGTGESGYGEFGTYVALSSDGNTALIGGHGDSSFHGAAWVFTRSGSTWTQQGEKLTPSDSSGLNPNFGDGVALSSDGNTALIGGGGDNAPEGQGTGVGAAWVFVPLAPPANTAPPTISGTAQQGQALTVVNGSWTNSPTSFAHQWQRCDASGNNCTPIAGATSQTYTLTAADVGSTIRVQETASNAAGAGTPVSSAALGPVIILKVPVNTAPPSLSVSGSAMQGQTLTALDGSWTNSPTSFAHQWQRCDTSGNTCTPIPQATGQTYTLAVADVGATIRVQETASNETGAGTPASSPAVGPVIAPPANTAPPTISGTAQQGQALTVVNGSWTNSPTSFTHQWQRCDASGNNCAPIPQATGQTYTLAVADVGATIRVQETASNAAGAGTPASSPAVGPVIMLTAPVNTVPPSLSVSGSAMQGQTLTGLDGSWTNSPTSFAHQWQRCDASGNNCTPIPEATGQTYTLAAADVGATIRVQETASNAAGAGTPASSAVVGPVISLPGFSPPHGTQITSSKVKQKKRSASFSFSAQGTVVGFQCELQRPKPKGRHKKLPKAAFGPCGSPKSYRHLRPGTYTFLVRAFNGAGADPSPASTKFKLR